MSDTTVILGAMAPSLKEQFPCLSDETAAQLDRDNQDFCRLRIRGLISDAEKRAINKRLTKAVAAAVREATADATT